MKKIQSAVNAFIILSFLIMLSGCSKSSELPELINESVSGSDIISISSDIIDNNLVNETAEKKEQIEEISVTGEGLQTKESSESVEEFDIKGSLFAMTKVNIRTEASTESPAIGSLLENEKIDYIGSEDDEWTAVLYGGRKCYIASRYLTDDPDWKSKIETKNGYSDGESIKLNANWRFADYSEINSGAAKMYIATADRKGIVVGINAGHGTKGGNSVKTWCHPDKTDKVTGGTTAAGATKAVAVSSGMTFNDGTSESSVTLKEAIILRDILLSKGYDVLMIRENDDVQLDNVARTVICNNVANCHIAIHWDSDGLDYDKGCFYMSVPDGIKYLDNVASTWKSSERLGEYLVSALKNNGSKIYGSGNMDMDLTQTSYSSIPSVDIELGNQCSDHSSETLNRLAYALADGVDSYFK